MEFFAFADFNGDSDRLREKLEMAYLDVFCASVEKVLETKDHWGRYYTVWGEYEIHCTVVRGGLRFIMPRCPNALTWSITTGFPPYPNKVTIHVTINREEADPDLVESLQDFTADWKAGLEEKIPE